jgi:plasmid maintenance system antidote protein VapI
MARPSHPGQFIRMEILELNRLSVTAAAKVLGVANDLRDFTERLLPD